MKTIVNVDEALRLFEENSIKQAQMLETGNYKVGNKCFDNIMKCLSYLYKQGKLEMVEPFLSHENAGVRETAAYAYLYVCPQKGEDVLSEIANGNYGFLSINAEMTLKEWKEGRLEFLFHEHEGKMIYIEFLDNKKPKDKERDSFFFKRIVYPILSFIIPKANPDFDHLYEKVHLWYLEYDDLNKCTCREIGIDDNKTVIVKAPYKDNVGYWTDNDMTLESYASHFNVKYIDKEKFDSIWDLELGTKISLKGTKVPGTSAPKEFKTIDI